MARHAIVPPTHPTSWFGLVAAVILASQMHSPALGSDWTPRGPWYGEVSAIAFGPGAAPPVYAGTGITVFWSLDGGLQWEWRGSGLPPSRVNKLIASSDDPGVVLAGLLGGGVYQSNDYGANWSPASGISATVQDLAVAELAGVETFFAASDAGMFGSNDGGATWKPAGLAGLDVNAVEYQPLDGLLFAAMPDGDVRRSPDGGTTWVPANAGIGGTIFAITAHPDSAGVLYAGGYPNSAVFKTLNGGTTWQAIQSPSFRQPTMFIYDIAIDSGTSSSVVIASYLGGAYRSENGGGTWQAANTGIANTELYALVAHPSQPGTFLCGSYRRAIYATTDGAASWAERSMGLSGSHTRAIALHPPSDRLWAGTASGILVSGDNGTTWAFSNFAAANAVTLDPSDPTRLFAGTSNIFFKGDVLRSTDGGSHWTHVYASPRGPVFDVVIDPDDPQFVCAALGSDVASGAVARSIDGGQSWGLVDLGEVAVLSLAIDPSNGQRLLAGTSTGLQESLDRGLSFHAIAPELGGSPVADIAFAPSEPDSIYLATSGSGVWRSGDGGLSFAQAIAGLPGVVRALALRPASGGHVLFAATPIGVFRSENHGDSWADISLGLPTRDMRTVVYHPGWGSVVVGTSGLGLWARQEPGTVDVPGTPAHDHTILRVEAPRPNPMGIHGTSIAYRLAAPGLVRIALNDVSGRSVRELAWVPREAGPHSFLWDGRDDAGRPVASGVYLLRVEDQTSGASVSRRLVVLR